VRPSPPLSHPPAEARELINASQERTSLLAVKRDSDFPVFFNVFLNAGASVDGVATIDVEWRGPTTSGPPSNPGNPDYLNAISGTTNVLTGWHHVAVTRSGTVMALFVDGQPQGSSDSTDLGYVGPIDFADPVYDDAPLTFGLGLRYGLPFHGLLDEIQIYDRALSAAEVLDLTAPPAPDSDFDGVPDADDACPLVPGTINGCPPALALDALEARVAALSVRPQAKHVMLKTLAVAGAAIDRGNRHAARVLPQVFVIEVRIQQRRGAISTAEGDSLIADAQAIAAAL